MSLLRTICLSILLISWGCAAYGDISPGRGPLPKPPMVAPVKIVEGKADGGEPNVIARIVIPRSLLPDLQEPSYWSDNPQEPSFAGRIFAGLALTAAAISLIFVSRTNPHRTKGMIFVIGCIVSVTIVVLGNLFFPLSPVPETADATSPQQLIAIEIQEYGHEVTLILPSQK